MDNKHQNISRRDFIKSGLSAGALLALSQNSVTAETTPPADKSKPNVLFFITDQQHINTIRSGGCLHLQTPAMDRLYDTGVRFRHSYSTNPVCIPARSSLFTGRMPTETGMWFNSARAGKIEDGMPTMGAWLREKAGYDTVYAGKWHVPHCHTYDIPGFDVLASGSAHWGETSDDVVSQACAQYLMNHDNSKPFLMVCSLLQPHDICVWLSLHTQNKAGVPYPELRDDLPPLPPNFQPPAPEPTTHIKLRDGQQPAEGSWEEMQWRYYLWAYYRHVEMVDAQIQRVLDALDQSGQAANTLIVFTSDHGEGMGEQMMVRKGYLYDSCAKVPLIFSLPGRIEQGKTINSPVSGVDIMPTICDFAGIQPPADTVGASLKSVLEGQASAPDRRHGDFVVTEIGSLRHKIEETGRMVRSERYKYIRYFGDKDEQLFDMANDPGETKNLIAENAMAGVLAEHRQMLCDWERSLKIAPRVAKADGDKWKEPWNG